MDSRGQRWQAGPGRFPRYLSKDGLGTSRCHGCVGRITEHTASTLRIWAVPCWELSRGWLTALLWIQQPTPMEDARVLPPLVDALKNKSLGEPRLRQWASARPTTSSHVGCGSGSLPLNSQTKKISADFPPARGNTSCIASGCSPALPPAPEPSSPLACRHLWACSQNRISPTRSGFLLNSAF